MPKISFKITDNSEQLKNATEESIRNALTIIGGKAAEYAANLAPVATGLLKNSITYALAGEAPAIGTYTSDDGTKSGSYSGVADGGQDDTFVLVGTNVEYAAAHEFGYKGISAKHYIANGVSNHIDEFKGILSEELQQI
jgi:hypothetical protein